MRSQTFSTATASSAYLKAYLHICFIQLREEMGKFQFILINARKFIDLLRKFAFDFNSRRGKIDGKSRKVNNFLIRFTAKVFP